MVPRKAIVATIAGTTLALSLHGGALAKNEKIEVTLSAPARATAPASIDLRATATARQQNHPVTQVEFLRGDLLIGVVTASVDGDQYVFHWTGVPAGTYSVTAKATNDKGDTDSSEPVQIVVNAPPSATLTHPSPGAIFAAPAAIEISANVADSDGSIARVEFFAGMERIGIATDAPYSFKWPNVASGTYSLTAVAIDNDGAASTSTATSIRVNASPSLSLTSPTANATFTAPANITLTAEAADSDGTIARVDFFFGDTLIATTSLAPFSFIWSGVPQGTYVLTARATDDLGATAASTSVNITINSALAQLYFIHVDHLNTPRLVTDAQQRAVWRWDHGEPFGQHAANGQLPAAVTFDFPLRLPGQYYDRETSVHYNHHRHYDPEIGRYEESDPIGLRGGLNTYAYVRANPLARIDPHGLNDWVPEPHEGGVGSGCGDVFSDPYVLDIVGTVNLRTPCRNHDKCYDLCLDRSVMHKIVCDLRFITDVQEQCRRGGIGTCFLLSSLYGSGPVFFGWGPYQRAQEKACKNC